MKNKIAIIGGGVSGLAAAHALREVAAVSVMEKSRGVSGRAASRTRHGVRFDHGANYFRIESPRMEQLVLEQLPTDDLIQIEKDIWTFDREGAIRPGDPEANAIPRLNYRSGISTLGKLLAAQSGAEIFLQTRVEQLIEAGGKWTLVTGDGQEMGPFDQVLCTLPLPQASLLMQNSSIESAAIDSVQQVLESSRYCRQFSVVLSVDGEVPRPGDFYALINSDREHDIAWLSFENDKAGRVPDDQTLMVVQMSPCWSAEHFEVHPDNWIAELTDMVSVLLDVILERRWFDTQRWKFAHPFGEVETGKLRQLEGCGLFFAGDGLVGKGRVSKALETGLEVADRMAASFGD